MTTNIGLGCVTFGREIDRQASYALMHYAHSIGIKDFDTAAAYSNGLSETIIGEWLAKHGLENGEINIATKILPPYHTSQIIAAVEASLNRLRIAAIDILYLHRWHETISDDTWLLLHKLKNKGKIKAIGVSNFNNGQLTNAVKTLLDAGSLKLSYIQNNHNLAVSDLTDAMKTICAANNISIVTYSPLGAGFLTGKHINGVAQGSRFEIMPAHQDIYFNEKAKKSVKETYDGSGGNRSYA